ncbi:energy transducer TonB [uncultured Psychroserpens sp.]|uniref:energy transducer TonB n=1 Tax=uncultured Psychroserpens sp. TaxID=255436 RepID=UPI0026272082|nr:energy transducer TonB [uncultured Psychroserpens sp.]
METYSLNIEFINNYLNDTLSKEERQSFESKLKSDNEFHTLYEEHLVFINGLKRVQIKDDILKAKRVYTTEKWLKISGISIVIIGTLITLYTLVFNTLESEPSPNYTPLNTSITDSTFHQEPAFEKQIDLSEATKADTISEMDVNYRSTTVHKKYGGVTTSTVHFTKKAEHLRFQAQNDTTITCKEGTILKIKGGSFINPNTGNVVTGQVELNVTEYYKISDILLQNLSTVSNGKQLETGGMLYVEAKQGDTTLELNSSSPIDILFPTTSKTSGMQLFSGEWKDQNINWTLQNDILEVVDIDDLSEELVEVPFGVVEQVPTFPGCEAEDNETRKKCTENAISKFINKTFNTDLTQGLGLSGKQRINCIFKIDQEGNVVFVQTRAPHPRLSEETDRVINMLPRFNPGMQRGKPVIVPYSLPINFTVEGTSSRTNRNSMIGAIDTVSTQAEPVFSEIKPIIVREPIEMDTIYTEERGMVEMIREVMHDKDFPVDSLFLQEWNRYERQKLIRIYGIYGTGSQKTAMLRKPLFDMESTKFKILEDDSITRGGHVIRKLWDPSRVPTTTRTITLVPRPRFTAGSKSVTAKEFDVLLDDTTSDISSRDVSYYALKSTNLGWINCDRFIRRAKRIKYKLKIKNAQGASVSMVFKSYKSVLPSWNNGSVYDFQTVGADEAVVLVAIKRKDGKLYYDMIETTTVRNPKIDFNFKDVSIEELKQALDVLNGL